ncbi:MAG: metallophosphoesterase [Elusimicrobia bacterium]|nr:metallophosphoesterase [Elusimicrobiota bacterium]
MTFVATPFYWLHLVFDLGIVATSCFFSWRLLTLARARGESRPEFLAAAAVAGGALGLAPWIILGGCEGTIWGFCLAARAAWTGATVAAPLAAAAAAARTRRWAWLLPAAALVALKWWGEVSEPANLEIQRVTITVAGLKNPVRVAHFSDLQTDAIRPMELRARDAANEFKPDFVVFTGDVLNHAALAGEVETYLAGFQAGAAKLFVGGDVDSALDRAEFESVTGFTWLDGRVKTYVVGRTRLAFLGFGLLDYRRGAEFAQPLVRRAEKADARIALSHRPDAVYALKGLPVSVLFTGHTHGGQVVLPGFGPPVTLTRVPREVAAGGVRRLEAITVSLARGFGREGHIAPRVRLFCRPHLILAELVPPAN